VHRIGRTGRAGRQGDAILFVAPREDRLLRAIEKATRKKIEIMDLPSTDLINSKRIAKFKQRIMDTLTCEKSDLFLKIVEQIQQEQHVSGVQIAAAICHLLQGDAPLLLSSKSQYKAEKIPQKPMNARQSKRPHRDRDRTPKNESSSDNAMESYRIEVGHKHNVKPGNIVGAIANEAGIDSQFIGRIVIMEDYSLVDLPKNMPKEIISNLKKIWVLNQQLKISRFTQSESKQNTPDSRLHKSGDKRAMHKAKSNLKDTHARKKTNKQKVRKKNKHATPKPEKTSRVALEV
jgi:ATP-dependent RNA helicase DeaD